MALSQLGDTQNGNFHGEEHDDSDNSPKSDAPYVPDTSGTLPDVTGCQDHPYDTP